MATSSRVTETCVLHIRPGIDFSGNDSPGEKKFMECSKMLKSARGVIRQYWGVGVDEPELFIHSVDWESPETWHAFMDSEMIEAYMKGVHELFDLAKEPTLIAHTRWRSIDDATKNFEAPLTIFSFFDIPDSATQEDKHAVDEAFDKMHNLTMTTAGGHGATHGQANDFILTEDEKMEPKPGPGMIHGMWSYPSVEHHKKWEQSPEIKEEEVIFDGLKERGLEMKPYKGVPGKHGERMFVYVKFRPGA